MGVKPHSEEIRPALFFAALEGHPVRAGANGNGISRKLPLPGRDGDHTLVILDTHGNESHRQPIQLGERHLIDANGNPGPEDRQRTWVARVPIPALGIGSIKVLDPADTEMFSTTIKLDP